MLRYRLEKQAEEFENAGPSEILTWASETFGEKLAVVTSFQPTGIVTLHMLQSIAPRTPALTLDTGLLFPETQDLIADLEQRLSLTCGASSRVKRRSSKRATMATAFGSAIPTAAATSARRYPCAMPWTVSMPG